jgi:hypothetical protein
MSAVYSTSAILHLSHLFHWTNAPGVFSCGSLVRICLREIILNKEQLAIGQIGKTAARRANSNI